jgi:hypothetical protein
MYVSHSELVELKHEFTLIVKSIVSVAEAMEELDIRLKHLEEEAAWQKHDGDAPLAGRNDLC